MPSPSTAGASPCAAAERMTWEAALGAVIAEDAGTLAAALAAEPALRDLVTRGSTPRGLHL